MVLITRINFFLKASKKTNLQLTKHNRLLTRRNGKPYRLKPTHEGRGFFLLTILPKPKNILLKVGSIIANSLI